MTKYLLSSLFLSVSSLSAWAVVPVMPDLGQADTLAHYPIGPGAVYTHIHFPKLPIHMFITEIDLNNPYNTVEQYSSNNRVPDKPRETTTSMCKNNSSAGHQVFLGVNHDFYDFGTQHVAVGLNARNGEIIWGNGNWLRSVLAVDKDKHMSVFKPITKVSLIFPDKGTMKVDFVNYHAAGIGGAEQCILFNQYNGLELTKAGYYVKVIPQSEFTINGEPTACLVKEMSDTPMQTSKTEYIIFCQYDKIPVIKDKLKVGDIVHIDQQLLPGAFGTPANNVKQLLHGYPSLVKDGEFHEGEYNDFMNGREKERYPLTHAGISRDGKKLYLCSVDGRSSKSIGISNVDLSGYMVANGSWDIVNFDGGGSTTFVVNGAVKNDPSDGSERKVMDSFHAVSTAPEDLSVAKIHFANTRIQTVAGAKTYIQVLGYNQYDALLHENINEAELSNDQPESGSVSGNSYVALRSGSSDIITARYNGLENQIKVSIAQPDSFRINTRKVIVGKDPVDLGITGWLDKKSFELDGSAFVWEVSDPSVCKVENGVLIGLKNGTVILKSSLEDLTDEVEVAVEILEGTHLIEDYSDCSSFLVTGTSNLKNLQLSNNTLKTSQGANLNFDFTKGRSSNLSLVKDIDYKGQPDSLLLTLNPGKVSIKNFMIYFKNANNPRGWSYNIEIPESDVINQLSIPLLNSTGEKLQASDFPLTFSKLYMILDDKSMDAGAYTIFLKDMKLKYGTGDQEVGLTDVSNIQGLVIYPNPASDFITVKWDQLSEGSVTIEVISLDGRVCEKMKIADLTTGTYHQRMDLSKLSNGTYLLTMKCVNEIKTMKLLINHN